MANRNTSNGQSMIPRLVALTVTLAISCSLYGQTTRHVDINNCPGPGDGTLLDPYCLIQDAIDASINGDEVIVAPGTYRERISFNFTAITLRSESDDPADTIIDGDGGGTVVTCNAPEGSPSLFQGFTIRGERPQRTAGCTTPPPT